MVGPEPNGVIAVFATREGADSALDWLRVDGIDQRTISILGPAMAPEDCPPELDHTPRHLREVASHWARWGGTFGALAGVGPIALIAAVVGTGPLALAVAAGLGAIAATTSIGALASALVGAGLHERQALIYERAIRDHKFIVVVHADEPDALRTAEQELSNLGAESVEVHGLTR